MFSSERYAALLEGLEVSEVTYSEVIKMSNDFRINSEFFSKQFLKLKDGKKLAFLPLKQLAKIADGDHSKFPDNQLEEVRYLQARDITNNFLEITSDVFVSKDYFAKNQRSNITENTILLSIMGTVGDIAITPKGFQASMCNRALAIIRDIKTISPQFLFAFLITKQAASLIERLKNGGVQQRINLDVLGELEIPNFGNELQDKVAQLVLLAQETRHQSKQKYSAAEQALLEAVGLAEFKPSTQNTNIKTFAQSFGSSGRLDAEYYQPKYEVFDNTIKSNKNGYTLIKNEYDHFKAVSRKPKAAYHYIEISDVNVSDGTNSPILIETNELPANAKFEVIKGDLIISKVRPNRGAITVIEDAYDNLIVSGAFTVLREKPISVFTKEVLKVLLRTPVYREWMLQFNVGTQYPVIRDEDILDLPIPKIDSATQTNISQLVQQSFSLKAQSEHLLDVAKRAVEMATEQDEYAAMHFIENSTNQAFETHQFFEKNQ